MLGLGDYDSPLAGSGAEEQADAPAADSAPASQLSIVDYHDGPEDADGAPAANGPAAEGVLGVTLDDDAVQHATQRRVGGMSMTVVKKTTTSAASSAGPAADAEAPDAEEGAAAPAFELPGSPTGELPEEMAKKFRALIEKTKEGYRVNEHIRNAKAFRNPDILEKLVAFFDVRECGTNYPPELYDTNELGKDEYFERLEEARRKWEERQARRPGEKMAFASGGVLNAPAAAAAAPPAVDLGGAAAAAKAAAAALAGKAAAAAAPRKSKWDGNAGGEPDAKRPHP